jgi:hypothetical protein
VAKGKFRWFEAVATDDRIPLGERAVLMYAVIIDVHGSNGQGTFRVNQKTLAGRCHTSRQTVNAALNRARRLGYLRKVERRESGPGRIGGDLWQLILPRALAEGDDWWG